MARARDLTHWFGAAWCTVGVLGAAGYAKRGNPAGLIALVPLGFVTAFNYDMGYGNKLQRIRREASSILAEERRAHAARERHGAPRFLPPDNNRLVSRAEYFNAFRNSPRRPAAAAAAGGAARPAGHPTTGGSGKGKCPF